MNSNKKDSRRDLTDCTTIYILYSISSADVLLLELLEAEHTQRICTKSLVETFLQNVSSFIAATEKTLSASEASSMIARRTVGSQRV